MHFHFNRRAIIAGVSLVLTFGIGCGGGTSQEETPAQTYSVGGIVSGLTGSLQLSLNGAYPLDVTSNGAYQFNHQLDAGGQYRVSVSTQPEGQNCEVANSSGILAMNVDNVDVTCTDNASEPPVVQNDEFDRNVDLLVAADSIWSVDMFDDSSRSIIADIGVSKSGWLVVVPQTPTSGEHNGWFENFYGPLIYQNVTGNFAVATHLRVVSRDNLSSAPSSTDYSAGGFVIRDPGGAHNGTENWVMYNMGAQTSATPSNGYAREVKKTVNSDSNMFLTDQNALDEYLLACRIGQQFYFYYWANDIGGWREESFYNGVAVDGETVTTRAPQGSSVTPEVGEHLPAAGASTPIYFDFSQNAGAAMPETVQVGVMGHNWSSAGDTRAEFDFVRFAATPPATQNDCTEAFVGLGNP